MPEVLDAATVLRRAPVVPVLTIPDLDSAVPLAQALVDGGLPVLEVTLRTAVGLDAIRAIAEAVPGAIVGAGTVRSADEFKAAVEAGSRFVVSPGLTERLLAAAADSPVTLIPGVATASELMRAREAGFDHVKFFPAEAAGGVKTLRSLGGPFPDMRFCPTGGVSLANLGDYLAIEAVVTVGGTWMTPADEVRSGNWAAIRRLAAEAAEQVGKLRGSS
jgi:2-dehydro-3-deoxyphosphogluconate aldolase/(4S)-4-hydroxy-2-oxoglutarate aldolase